LSATPPYRIETERLVIRCYEPEDAPLLKAAVDSSIEHLLPWMPWARFEPQSLEEKVELCRMFRGQFDLDTNYVYGIFSPDETAQLGGSGFHKRGNEGSLEIGYWVAASAIGRRTRMPPWNWNNWRAAWLRRDGHPRARQFGPMSASRRSPARMPDHSVRGAARGTGRLPRAITPSGRTRTRTRTGTAGRA